MTDTQAISLDESLRFAALSGDFNPLHVDPERARRLPFGGTVVHGVSVLMRALDVAFQRHGGRPIASLSAQFDLPIMTGQSFEVESECVGADITLRIRTAKGIAQRIVVHLTDGALAGPTTAPLDASPVCKQLDFEAAAQGEGTLPFAWDASDAISLYPSLANLPPWQLAALAATTRIVGMECPGLHSVYTSLHAQFREGGVREDLITWRVAHADKRFRLLRIAADSKWFSAQIEALVRPAPVMQPTFAEVCATAQRARFVGRRAFIVGGNRGLGEVAAKILAAGGADVTITYARGRADAEALVEDIRSGGGLARACAFDVLTPSDARPSALPVDWTPTDLLYFASPQIVLTPGARWSESQFQLYCSYFVSGFANTFGFTEKVLAVGKNPLRVFYPSTIYVSAPPPGGAEYAAAKSAGEAYCTYLRTRRPGAQVDSPRLPRMLTDQTSSVRTGPMELPLPVLLQYLI